MGGYVSSGNSSPMSSQELATINDQLLSRHASCGLHITARQRYGNISHS